MSCIVNLISKAFFRTANTYKTNHKKLPKCPLGIVVSVLFKMCRLYNKGINFKNTTDYKHVFEQYS